MSDLDKFLKGEPLNERIADLRKGIEDDDLPDIQLLDATDPGGLTDDDREHLRLLLAEPGWRVLLKLLDTDIQKLEDAARRRSLSNPLSDDLKQVWADAAYAQKARERIVILAANEVQILLARKAHKEELDATLLGR